MIVLKSIKIFFLEKYKIDFVFILLLFTSFSIEICLQISGATGATSIMLIATTIILFSWILFKFLNYIFMFCSNKKNGISFKNSFFKVIPPKEFFSYLIVIIIILISLINIIVSVKSFNLTFDFFLKFFLTMFALILIALFYSSRPNKLLIQIILLISLLVAMYSVFSYLIGLSNIYSIVDVEYASGKYLTMNFSNPNELGFFMIMLSSIMVFGAFVFRKIFIKIIYLIFATTSTIFLFLSGSRTSIATLIIFAIVAIFMLFILRKTKIHPVVSILIIILPLIIAASYIVLINIISNIPAFKSYIDSIGSKTIMSRYYIWIHSFNAIRQNPFFGDYFFLYISNYSNLHNYILDFLAYFGIVPTTLMILFLSFIIISFGKTSIYSTKSQVLSLTLFFIPIFAGTGESLTLYFGLAMPIIYYLPLLFIQYPFARNSIIENDALLFRQELSRPIKNKPTILTIDTGCVAELTVFDKYNDINLYQHYSLIVNNDKFVKLHVGHININYVPRPIKKLELSLEIKRLVRYTKPEIMLLDELLLTILDKAKIVNYLNKKNIKLITY